MKFLRLILPCALAASVALTGCETTPKEKQPPKPSRAGEAEMKKLVVAGVKLGDNKSVLRKFRQAKRVASSQTGVEVFEIYKPNAQISMLVLSFRDGRVWKMELRYFNGPTERTLTTAGGWNGLRDILIKRFGPPVKVGAGVPQLNTLRGLNPGYARFNGVWNFPKIYRQMHYIVLSDSKGGVGIVTFLDSTARPTTTSPTAPGSFSTGPNPGF